MDTRTVSMESKGVMQEIREHLAGGKSSTEVIALGYKSPTVFKVQRQLGRTTSHTPLHPLARRFATGREVNTVRVPQGAALGAPEAARKSLEAWMASKDSQLDDLSDTVEALVEQVQQLTNALPHDDLRICVCCHHPFNKCTCLHPPTEG